MTLPDVNFWLALTFESHCHHVKARSWFEKQGSSQVGFSRITMLGFLRLVQNSLAFPGEAVISAQAWSFYQAYRSDDRVIFYEEPQGIEELLGLHLSSLTQSSPKQLTDNYLAAFAVLCGLKLHIFDEALQKHSLLK